MPLFRAEERRAVESLARIADANPFSPEFVDGEREILGPEHAPPGAVWSLRTEPGAENSALARIGVVAERAARGARDHLLRRRLAAPGELRLYAAVVIFTLYQRYADPLHEIHLDPERARRRVPCYRSFRRDLDHFLPAERLPLPQRVDAAHLFACFYQVRRAFHLIHRHIVGASAPAARLRAAVWESIFTHDMQRYWRSLHDRMHDVTTLIPARREPARSSSRARSACRATSRSTRSARRSRRPSTERSMR